MPKAERDSKSESEPKSRFFINKTVIKNILGSLGLSAEPEAISHLVDVAKSELVKFGGSIADVLNKKGNPSSVDRDHIPGDRGNVKAALFSETPFKNAIRELIASKTGMGGLRLPKATVDRAAATFQNLLGARYSELAAKEGNITKGSMPIITSKALGGPTSKRQEMREQKARERKEQKEGKKNQKKRKQDDSDGPKEKKSKKSEDASEKKKKDEWDELVTLTKPKRSKSRKEILKSAVEMELKRENAKKSDGEEEMSFKGQEKEAPVRASKIRRRSKKPGIAEQLEAARAELAKYKNDGKKDASQEKAADDDRFENGLKFMNDVITLANYNGADSEPSAILSAYAQVARRNPEVRYGHLKDNAWAKLKQAFPQYLKGDASLAGLREKLANGFHPSREKFDDMQDELRSYADNVPSSSADEQEAPPSPEPEFTYPDEAKEDELPVEVDDEEQPEDIDYESEPVAVDGEMHLSDCIDDADNSVEFL